MADRELPDPVESLERVFAVEAENLLVRFAEIVPFWDNVPLSMRNAVARLVDRERRHARRVLECAAELGALPRKADPRFAGLHYTDLAHLLPRMIDSTRRLAEAYAALAGERMTEALAALVSAGLEHHRAQLADLQALGGGGDARAA